VVCIFETRGKTETKTSKFNVVDLTPLFKDSDMPSKVGLLLVLGDSFGQMHFMQPPMTHGYQWELNPDLLGASLFP